MRPLHQTPQQGQEHEQEENSEERMIQPLMQRQLKRQIQPLLKQGHFHKNSPLPDKLQANMEKGLGEDFSKVKVVKNSDKAKELGAKAFTQGQDIHFAPGKFDPASEQGKELIGHELAHVVQQRSGKVTQGNLEDGTLINQDPGLESEADKMAQAALEGRNTEPPKAVEKTTPVTNAAAPVQMYLDDEGNTLPDPLVVTWGSDKFQISFYRSGSYSPKFEFVVKYLGAHPTDGPGVVKNSIVLSADIGTKQLNASIISKTESSLVVDLYGDGLRKLRLEDEFSLDTRFNKKRREHDFALKVNGESVYLSSMWVEDAKAKALEKPKKEEEPGQEMQYKNVDDKWLSILVDGDGDQHKELEVKLISKSWYEQPFTTKEMLVQLVQRSSRRVMEYTFSIPKPTGLADKILPHEPTDGKSPTVLAPYNPFFYENISIKPPMTNGDKVSYQVVFAGKAVTFTFPKETKALADVFKEGNAHILGNVVYWDMSIGAYNDKFRVAIIPTNQNKALVSISPLFQEEPVGTEAVEMALNGPIRFKVINSSPVSFAADLNNDGTPDIYLYDQLTSVYDNTSPEKMRQHRIRMAGPSIAEDKTFDFTFEDNVPNRFVSKSDSSKLADSHATALTTLKKQQKSGDYTAQTDLYQGAMLRIAAKAVKEQIISQSLFTKWMELTMAMTLLRPQSKGTVDAGLQSKATQLAEEYHQLISSETKGKIKPMTASMGGSTSYNPYSQDMWTVAAFYSNKSGPGISLPENLKAKKWSEAFRNYRELSQGFNQWVTDSLSKKKGESSTEVRNAALIGKRAEKLNEIQQHNPKRIFAVYHPDKKMESEKDYVKEIPLELYYWKSGGEWHLRDITNPDKTWTYTSSEGINESHPPLSLLYELNDPDHFAEGLIHYEIPGFRGGYFKTTHYLTWKQCLTYLGLGLAGIGLALATLSSFGVGGVAVPALWAFAASGIVGATAAGIDMAEHIKRGNLDGTTALLDVAQIVGGIASAGALSMGRIAVVGAANKWVGPAAKFTLLADRIYVPLVATAAGADAVTLAVLTVDAAQKIDQIEKGSGNPEDKRRAKMLLISQLAIMGGITALSLKGTIPDLKRGRTVILDMGADGVPVASDARVWFLEQPAVKKAMADPKNPNMKATFDANPDAIYKMMLDPDLRQIISKVPKTMENIAGSPKALKFIEEVLEEVNRVGAAAIVKTGSSKPSSTKMSDQHFELGKQLQAKYNKPPVQPGYTGQKGNLNDIEPYLEILYKQAREADAELKPLADSIAASTGGVVSFRPSAKDKDRAIEKIQASEGDPTKLADLAGCMVIYKSIDDLYKALPVIEKHLNSNGAKIIRLKDRFVNPQNSGFRDILINVQMSNGHIAEFRVAQEAINDAAKIEHKTYEIYRSLEAKQAFTPLSEREKAIMISIEKKSQQMYDNIMKDWPAP